MAKIGARHSCFAKMTSSPDANTLTYDSGFILGKLNAFNLSPNYIEGEYYADDSKAETLKEFLDADGDLEIDYLSLANESTIYGATLTDGLLTRNQYDDPPFGCYGFYKTLVINKVRKYRGYFYPKVQCIPSSEDTQTRSGSLTLTGEKIKFKAYPVKVGDREQKEEFTTEAAAKAWVESKAGVAAYFEVNISVSGVGTISPTGTVYVASGEDLEIAVTGSPTAAYDNGTSISGSISANKYTISDIAANHDVVFIYTA